MPVIHSTVNLTNNFGNISRNVEEVARHAVGVAAREGGQVAAEKAAERRKTGAMGSIRVSSPTRSDFGWEATFLSPVFYAWFQDRGTKTGISPLRFLEAGLAAGRKAMRETIHEGLQ